LGQQSFLLAISDYNFRGGFYKLDGLHCFRFEFEADNFRGSINSDGAVSLHTGTLADTFLWKVLSDIGQERKIEAPDSAPAVQWMLEYVKDFYETYGQDAYHGREAASFLHTLKDYYKYQSESRFADGYCSAVSCFWPAACFEIFGERRDYPYRFMY
jgi:hypothetical protein